MRLIQITSGQERRVGLVDGERIRLVDARKGRDIYSFAMEAIDKGLSLSAAVESALSEDLLEYGPIYEGTAQWKLLPSFDHPSEPARCMVSGTGLTHKASAQNRAAMHKRSGAELTDSMRMYRDGTGRRASGRWENGCAARVVLQGQWIDSAGSRRKPYRFRRMAGMGVRSRRWRGLM